MTRARDIANFGDGIATADIGDGQITAGKLASGAITSAALPTGSVLQVVNGVTSTGLNSSLNTFSDTGLTATITPTSTTSKILVLVSQAGCRKGSGSGSSALELKLLRDTTDLLTFEGAGGYTASSSDNFIGSCSACYLDSPSTTSAITYKTQMRNEQAVSYVGVQVDDCTSTITLMEIAG